MRACLEEDDLAVGLAAKLKADGNLRHSGVADVSALFVHAPGAVRAANHHAALADGREDGIGVARPEELAALTGVTLLAGLPLRAMIFRRLVELRR